jgi:hypothetical protein
MSHMMPQFSLTQIGKHSPEMLNMIGEKHKDNPSLAASEKSKYVDSLEAWESRYAPSQPGVYSRELRAGLQKERPAEPKQTLLTGKPSTTRKRKRIYGMGKSTGEAKSGEVKKQSLGGK